MPRSKRILSSLYPYHVRARVNNRDWYYIPLEELWPVIASQLSKVSQELGAEITAFMLMSNHFHMLIWTPFANLSAIMHRLQGNVSRTVGLRSGRENHLYGRRFQSTLIENDQYFADAYRYLYQNPLRAGLVRRVQDYPFSTLAASLGERRVPFPLFDPHPRGSNIYPLDPRRRLQWLNELCDSAQLALVRGALKKSQFMYKTTQKVPGTI